MKWFRKKKVGKILPDLRIKFKDIDGGIDIIDRHYFGPFMHIPPVGSIFKNDNILWKIEEVFVDNDSYETGYHEVIVVKMSKIS